MGFVFEDTAIEPTPQDQRFIFEDMPEPQGEAWTGPALKQIGREALALPYGIMKGAQSAMQFFDDAATLISNATGWEKGGLFQKLAEMGEPPMDYTPQSFAEEVVAGLGEAVPEIGMISALPGPAMVTMGYMGAIRGGAHGGVKEAVREGAKGALLGGTLHGAGMLPKVAQVPIVGGVFGGMAAMEGGDTREIAKSTAIGAGLGLMGKRRAKIEPPKKRPPAIERETELLQKEFKGRFVIEKEPVVEAKKPPEKPKIAPTVKEKVKKVAEVKPTTLYKPRGLEDAKTIRQEQGSLATYNLQAQKEWLGNRIPPKDGKITLYRATPEGKDISPGDYVTNRREYAQLHIESNLGGKGKITSIKATLDDIFPADGPKEFWYAPKSIEKPTPKAKEVFDITTTDTSHWDNLLKKGEAKIVRMTPDEYLKQQAKAKGTYPEKISQYVSDKTVTEYAERMRKGEKAPMPIIDWVEKTQEGRARVLAAKQLGQKEIPIVVREKSNFELGRDVNIALPKEIGLKPTEVDMQQASNKLGIQKTKAWKAWTEFTYGKEALTKPIPKAKEPHRDYLNVLLDEVKQGEVVRIPHEEGGYRRASTYPKFMQKKRWTGNEVALAIDKELKGIKLGSRQQEIVDAALSEAKARWKVDLKDVAKLKAEKALEEGRVFAGDLKIGDEIRIAGDKLKVTKIEDDIVTLKNGQTLKIGEDKFIEGARRAKPTQARLIPKEEAKLELKVQEAPPKLVGPLHKKAVFPTEKIKAATKGEQVSLIKEPGEQTTLYGGLPIHKVGQQFTKHIGEPIWDKAVMKGIPKLLEKIPGGKAINRAFIYEYRGTLPDAPGYMKSMEEMRRYQSIGREYAVDIGKRLQAMPEREQLKLGEYIRGETYDVPKNIRDLGNEAKRALYELGRQSADLGLLSEKTFFKNAGRYMPRLYTSKEYQSLLTLYNLKKATRLDLSRFKKRKDIPKEIREQMGEILTPGYPVAKGIAQLTHDVEMARWFTGIAQNREWALPKKLIKELDKAIPKDWKQLPSNKKLGQLSESYVHPEIFADLQQTIRIMETPERIWRKSLGAWKFGKVILSPKTHVRNLMSNSVLAHLGGLPMYEQPIYLVKGAKAMLQKNKYWKMAKEEGLLQTTFTQGELRTLFDQVDGQIGGIKASSVPEKLALIGKGWDKTKMGLGMAAKLYEAEEQWFKMAKMIHGVERKGMSATKAAKDAEKWLFNYAKVTKFQEKYRTKWYGAPFATFTFKALPRIAEAVVKTPWRFALPLTMIYALERAAQEKIGDTIEEIKAKKELRAEWMKGKGLGKYLENVGLPNFARVPFIDENGREYFLNLTYILPWGDIGEGGGIFGIPGGIRPFSQPFIKEPVSQMWGEGGYDPFWEEEIVKEKDIAGLKGIERIKKEVKLRAKHVVQAMAPTPVMDVMKAISAIREEPDYKGRFRPRAIVAADIFAGVKMYPVDYIERAEQEINKLHPQKGYLARKIMGDIKTLSIKKQAMEKTGRKVTFYDEKIEEKIKQLIGLANETREVGKVFETIRKHKK